MEDSSLSALAVFFFLTSSKRPEPSIDTQDSDTTFTPVLSHCTMSYAKSHLVYNNKNNILTVQYKLTVFLIMVTYSKYR